MRTPADMSVLLTILKALYTFTSVSWWIRLGIDLTDTLFAGCEQINSSKCLHFADDQSVNNDLHHFI